MNRRPPRFTRTTPSFPYPTLFRSATKRRALVGTGRKRAAFPGPPKRAVMVDWIARLVEGGGYLGIAALMFAENLFPPIPSELIMPLAGFAAARGELDIFLAVAAGSAGSKIGRASCRERVCT